jgi:hypothetical protein
MAVGGEDRGATGSSEAPGRQGFESMQPVVSVG